MWRPKAWMNQFINATGCISAKLRGDLDPCVCGGQSQTCLFLNSVMFLLWRKTMFHNYLISTVPEDASIWVAAASRTCTCRTKHVRLTMLITIPIYLFIYIWIWMWCPLVSLFDDVSQFQAPSDRQKPQQFSFLAWQETWFASFLLCRLPGM